jgi:hypothetical protein
MFHFLRNDQAVILLISQEQCKVMVQWLTHCRLIAAREEDEVEEAYVLMP